MASDGSKELVPMESAVTFRTEKLTENPWNNSKLDSTWLVYLNASNSKIVLLDFLVNLPNVEVLILQHNLIESLEYIWLCKNLFHLDVSHNKIKSIESIGRFAVMGLLNLSDNKITWTELERIHHLQIVDAHFSDNPELHRDAAYYRLHMIDCLPNLWSLDGRLITALERSRVKDFFQNTELSSKPVRHKLSGLVFKQTNNHHGEVLTARAVQFLRRFNVTVSHTSQLDERRLLFTAEMLCEDLASLNSPTWSALPAKPEILATCPKLLADAVNMAQMDVTFGVDLLSGLITSLLFDLPADLIPFIVTLPKNARFVNKDITSAEDFFSIPGALRLRLASLLLSRVELDYSDPDRCQVVADSVHDSSFFAIASHILLSFLRMAPTDPRQMLSDSESFFPRQPTAAVRQCSTLFGARTVFTFLKTIFSSVQNEPNQAEVFANFVIKGATILSSELMTPLIIFIKDEELFRSTKMIGHVLTSELARAVGGENVVAEKAVAAPTIDPGSPAEVSAVSTLAREMHILYTELIDRLPAFYDMAAHAVNESATRGGAVGVQGTPIGASRAVLARPPPTPLRSRDALNYGRHVIPAGPPALRTRPTPKRPNIGDCVLVAIQHTGRIIAAPDMYTVCVQLDVVPDRVGLHPPGSNPFRPAQGIPGPSTPHTFSRSVQKNHPTLSTEYSYMYFNVADLKWDTGNGIWRSHISNAPVGRLYLHRSNAAGATPTPNTSEQQRRTKTPSGNVHSSSNHALGIDADVDEFDFFKKILSPAGFNANIKDGNIGIGNVGVEDMAEVEANAEVEVNVEGTGDNGDDDNAQLPGLAESEPTVLLEEQQSTMSHGLPLSPVNEGVVSVQPLLRRDSFLEGLKAERKAGTSRVSSAPNVVRTLSAARLDSSKVLLPSVSSIVRGRIIRSAGLYNARKSRMENRLRRICAMDIREHFINTNNAFAEELPFKLITFSKNDFLM